MNCYSWFPRKHLSDLKLKYAFVILNSGISNKERVLKLWSRASYRVLVDGAANRWFHMLQSETKTFDESPNLVTGDFDSICPKVREYFETKVTTCKVIFTPDQELTDFTKSLKEIATRIPTTEQIEAVYAYTEYSGRLDQIFGLFQSLFLATRIDSLPPVFLISSNSIDWLLLPGRHKIDLTSDSNSNIQDLETYNCGLIPLGEPCNNVITSGLKWNLSKGQILAFGKLISTSNKIVNDIVTIENETPLIWTMEI